jgi:hypothetical protein
MLVVPYGTGNHLTHVGRGGVSELRVTIKSVEFGVLHTCAHPNVTVSLPLIWINIHLIRIRIQISYFKLNADPDPDPGF